MKVITDKGTSMVGYVRDERSEFREWRGRTCGSGRDVA